MGQEEQAKRQAEAKGALIEFRERFNKEFDTITTAYKWRESVEPLQSILRKYKDAIPAETWQRLQNACRLNDETSGGIKAASDILNVEIEKAIKVLQVKTKTKGSSKSAGIGGIVAAIIIIGIFAYINLAAFPVTIRNNGCEQIVIPVKAPVWAIIFGLDLPKQPIHSGQSAMAKFPPSTVLIDATSKETIKMSMIGVDVYFERPSNVDSVMIDGQEVLDQSKTFDLRESVIPEEQKSHELVIACSQG
ncbi:MAG: hypothetical protein HMLIMOIP_000774 [Candidatus Nitrosomirales archaeon]|jgi:hypothetical protein